MKLFAFLFVAMFSVVEITSNSSEEFIEDAKKWFDQCGTELDVPKEKMEEYESMTEPSDEKMVHCLTACVLEKAGFMEDGKLKSDKIDQLLDQKMEKDDVKILKEALKKCGDEASGKEEKCAIAGTFGKCVFEELKSVD